MSHLGQPLSDRAEGSVVVAIRSYLRTQCDETFQDASARLTAKSRGDGTKPQSNNEILTTREKNVVSTLIIGLYVP
jgi:hypothetical protein